MADLFPRPHRATLLSANLHRNLLAVLHIQVRVSEGPGVVVVSQDQDQDLDQDQATLPSNTGTVQQVIAEAELGWRTGLTDRSVAALDCLVPGLPPHHNPAPGLHGLLALLNNAGPQLCDGG